MKNLVLTSNDNRDSLSEDTVFSVLLFTDENGKDPFEAVSKKIWERMQSDLEASGIVQVKLNHDIVYQEADDDMMWDEIKTTDLKKFKKLTHNKVKKTYGLLRTASVVVRGCDDLICGIFHKSYDLTPNAEVEY